MKSCRVCGKDEPEHMCTSCGRVHFCNEHVKEKEDHQKACQKCEIVLASGKKRSAYMVTTCSLEPGALVRVEEPIVLILNSNNPHCAGCFAQVPLVYRCELCNWPLCSALCQSSRHHQPECQLFCGFNTRLRRMPVTFGMLPALRVLALRSQQPSLWAKLPYMDSRDPNSKLKQNYTQIIRRWGIEDFLRFHFPNHRYSREALMLVCSLLASSTLSAGSMPGGTGHLFGLYPELCCMEHSCLPNCYLGIGDATDPVALSAAISGDIRSSSYMIFARCTRNIPPRARLTIDFISKLSPTAVRQYKLTLRGRTCNCSRCADPTELGTYIGAFQCLKKQCEGSVLRVPEDAFDSFWSCDKCSMQRCNKDIAELADIIANQFREIENVPLTDIPLTDIQVETKKDEQSEKDEEEEQGESKVKPTKKAAALLLAKKASSIKKIKELKEAENSQPYTLRQSLEELLRMRVMQCHSFIDCIKELVHPNYFLILRSKMMITHCYADACAIGAVQIRELMEAYDLCKEVLSVLIRIEPGAFPGRGIMEYRSLLFEQILRKLTMMSSPATMNKWLAEKAVLERLLSQMTVWFDRVEGNRPMDIKAKKMLNAQMAFIRLLLRIRKWAEP